jgi:predicted acyltransferase
MSLCPVRLPASPPPRGPASPAQQPQQSAQSHSPYSPTVRTVLSPRPRPASPPMQQRLVSLDAFRGITMVGMILVNNPGTWSAMYGPLQHAEWHGWTPTDLIFPFFLFIVGVSIAYSFGRAMGGGASASGGAGTTGRGTLAAKSGRRALILFGLGLLMAAYPIVQWTPEWAWIRPGIYNLRIMGVLQRIALCYLAVSLLFLYTRRRTQTLTLWGLLLGYWGAMAWVGHLDDKVLNLAAVVDRAVLGTHLWVGADRMWDPEGLLSTLPAISTTLMGVWAARILRSEASGEQKTAELMVTGGLLLGLGYVWGWFFPINKSLWTSSYVALTGGQAFLALGMCYWFVDVRGWSGWTRPFTVYGVNAITVFFMSGIIAKTLGFIRVGDVSLQRWIFVHGFDRWMSTINASLAYSVVWVLAWYVVLQWMYRRGIILKV